MGTEERRHVSHKHETSAKVEAEEEVASCHSCGVCGRSFPLLSSLSQHMRRHTREKPYKCPYCEHRTAQKGSLKAHIRSHKLGLLNHNISVKGEEVEEPQYKVGDPPECVDVSDKSHHVNGKVKKKLSKKNAKSKSGDETDSGPFICVICEQVFPQLLPLKAHMKRQHDSQDHECRVCGRRFRQAWFLQSHMRIHRVKAELQGSRKNNLPTTINDVPQDPALLTNTECLYELCAGCGNFFHDRKALRIHEKLHRLDESCRQGSFDDVVEACDTMADKIQFLRSLNLVGSQLRHTHEEEKASRRIPELDPVSSYQAWQLATRGRLVEAYEKCLGWEERLAEAEVAYDTEKGEYIPLKPDKKRKQLDSSNPGVKKKKSDVGLRQHLTKTKSSDKKVGHKDRIVLNGLGHAFYEAMQTKKVKEVHISTKLNIQIQGQEANGPLSCDRCDFRTAEASLLCSHLQAHHAAPCGEQNPSINSVTKSGSKSSKYRDYLRSRSLMLSQPYWSTYTILPAPELTDVNIKTEKSRLADPVGGGSTADDCLLNLSSPTAEVKDAAVSRLQKSEGLVRHQCPYCSHTTNYPEVLWVHQRISHKVDSNSSAAPKWAPIINVLKSLKAGASQWRRTGPPPFLEGKDCPALQQPRTHRTLAPGLPGQSAGKHSTSKSKHHSKESGASSSNKAPPQPQRKSAEPKRGAEGGTKGATVQATSSTTSARTQTAPAFPSTRSPKHRGSEAAVEGVFPQEGLGFILARNRGAGTPNSSEDSGQPNRQQPYEFSAGLKSPDLWSAMNMWRLHGSKAYFDPLGFAQGKSAAAAAGERPGETDILSLLKNYTPHELAALYQHWGFVDPRLDPQAVVMLNGSFGNEVQSTSEASKQMSAHSSCSSGSLHKGT